MRGTESGKQERKIEKRKKNETHRKRDIFPYVTTVVLLQHQYSHVLYAFSM